MANAITYVKNVGKSFGYSAIDVFKEYNPQVTALASGAKELGSTLYQSIDNFKASLRDTEDEKGLLGKGKDSFGELRKNLFDDLKSGNWYNKQRVDEVENEAIGAMFGFDDDTFNLDDLDFDFSNDDDLDSDDGIDEGTEAIVSTQKQSANAMIYAMDAVGSRSAAAISTATVKSADYVVASQRQSSKALYSLNQRGFHQMSTGLAAINANISSLIALGEPLTTHMQNSATFFTNSGEYQKSVLEKLDTLIKLNTPSTGPEARRQKNTLSSLLTAEGVIDFGSYFDMISENIKNLKDDMLGMADMFGGPEQMIKMAASSPLKLVTTGITKKLIPNMLKDTMQSMNNHLESFFGAALDKLDNSNFDGPFGELFSMIKDSIMPKNGYKDKVDTSQYNKGKVDWSGTSKIALEEVIPTYLSEMTSALTGGPVTVYNYETGKFETKKGVKNAQEQQMRRAAQMAGGDFREDALAVIDNLGFTEEAAQDMKKQVENFFFEMFKTGKGKLMDINKDTFEYQNYGIDEETLKVLRNVLSSYARLGKTDKAMRAATEMRLGRDRYGDQIRNIEAAEINNPLRSLYNQSDVIRNGNKYNKVKPGGILGVDKFNHDIFYYLQGIYQYTGHVSDNLIFLASGGRSEGVGRGDIQQGGDIRPIRDISHEVLEADEEEISTRVTRSLRGNNGPIRSDSSIDEFLNLRHEYEDGAKKKKKYKSEKYKEAERRKEELERNRDAGNEDFSQEELDKINEILEESSMEDFTDRLRNRIDDNETVGSVRKVLQKVQGIFTKPGQVIADILGAGEISMYHLLYGKGGDDEKGLFAYFFSKADSMFERVDNFLTDKLNSKWDSFKDWVKGMFKSDDENSLGKATKRELKSAWGWVKKSARNAVGLGSSSSGEGETEPIGDNGSAAFGRKVTKTGIVAVSEGEMIIPSEYNPYYHGSNNKSTQIANENKAIGKFFGSYARGGMAGAKRQEFDSNTNEWVYYDDKGVEIGRAPASARDIARQHGKMRTQGEDNYRAGQRGRQIKSTVKGSFSTLLEGGMSILRRILPSEEDTSIIDRVINEENKKRLKEANVPQEAIKNKGALGAGAIIGAGASILSGAIVGPFAGAAIGAGVGLIIRSEKVQKALFGEVGENGEREGGIVPKKISNLIMDQVPSIGKGAGAGAVAGLFMGSPIVGALVGGTIGYISSSEKAKAALFGKQNEDGTWSEGLIKKELQDKIKKNAPNIGAGMIAGLVAGPFGLVGNLVVGAGMGYLTTTDKFQDMILGKKGEDGKREGGLIGDFRTYLFGKKEKGEKQGIFTSITGIFQKVANEVRIHSRDIFKDTGKLIRRMFAKGAQSSLGQKLATSKVVKGVKAAGKGALAVAKSPFKGLRWGLEGIDNSLGRRALRRGYGMRNSDGSQMTAEQRLAQREAYGMESGANRFRNNLNNDYRSNKNLDKFLANATEEQLKEFRTVMSYYEDPTKQFDEAEKKHKKDLTNMLESAGVDPRTAIAIEEGVNKGKDVSNLLSRSGLDPDKLEAVQKKIQEIQGAKEGRAKAKADKKTARRELLQGSRLLHNIDGFDIRQDSDIRNMLDLAQTELDARFKPKSEEEQQQEKEEKREDEKVDRLNSLNETLHKIFLVISGRGDELSNEDQPREDEDNNEEGNQQTARDAVNNSPRPEGGGDTGLADERDDIVTQTDGQGNIFQMRRNDQGELEMDLSDNQTRQAMQNQQRFREAINHIPLIGGVLGGLGGAIKGLKDGLLGNEEKEGIFSKLFKGLFGEDGVLSGIFSFITDSPIGQGVKTVLGRVKLGGLLTGVIGPALAISALGGKFDSLGETLSGKLESLRGNDTTPTLADNKSTTINGKQLATDENGNFIKDENGRYQTTDGEFVSGMMENVGTDTSVSSQMKKNLITGTIVGKGSVMSAAAAGVYNFGTKLATGTKGTATASTIGKALMDGGGKLASGIMASIAKLLEKIPTILTKIPFIKKWVNKDSVELICTTIYSHLDDAVKAAGSKLAGLASKIGDVLAVVKVAFVIGAGIDAWGNAESILGITEEATTGQRVIAVLIAVLNALIPIIGNLIPNKVLVNIFMAIAPKIGIDVSSLEEQRQRAEAEVAAYNEENGTDLSIEEYNQMNGRAGVITKAKNFVGNIYTNIKEQGIGGTIKAAGGKVADYVNDKVQNFRSTFEESGLGEAVASTLQGILPGPLGDIAGNAVRMKDMAMKGDIQGLMSTKLLNSNEESGTLTKVIDTILTTLVKVPNIPLAVVSKGAHMLVDGVKGIIDKITGYVRTTTDNIRRVQDDTERMVNDPNSSLSDFFNFSMYTDDEGNPLGGVSKGIMIATRLTSFAGMLFSAVGRRIGNFIGGIVQKVKGTVSSIATDTVAIHDLAKSGDISGLINYQAGGKDGEENPVSGIVKAANFMTKVGSFPSAIFHFAGNKVKDFIQSKVDAIKCSIAAVGSDMKAIKDLSDKGDPRAVMSYEAEDNEENPMNGVTKATVFMTKATHLLPAVFHYVGNGVSSFITTKVDAIKDDYSGLTDSIKEMKDLASEGDAGAIWKKKFESNKENPLGLLFKGFHGINKMIYSVVAMVQKIIGPIADIVDGVSEKVGDVVDGVKEFGNDVKEGVSNAWNTAKDTVSGWANDAWDSAKNFITGGGSGIGGEAGAPDPEFISQKSQQFGSIPFADSDVSEKGCAPAAATMLMNTARPGSINMKQAIDEARPFENKGGTSADYFGKVFNKHGLSGKYYNMSNGNESEDFITNLREGKPAVVLGKDPSNGSKANSPFGPNNHYVMFKGIDDYGNIIVNDPESDTPDQVYDSSILKNVSMAVTAKAGEDPSNYGKNFANQAGLGTNDAVIWSALRKYFKNDYAPAGIMGCWEEESKNSSNRVEGDYMRSFPGSSKVLASNSSLNEYTQNTLFPAYAKSNVKINQSAYKGSDGNYYPGVGLAQWTGGRGYKLFKFAQDRNLDWRDLGTQIEYFKSEMDGSYSGVRDALNNATSVTDATRIAYNKYEGCKREDWFQPRLKHAQSIYSTQSGKPLSDAELVPATGAVNASLGGDTGKTSFGSNAGVTGDAGSSGGSDGGGGILGILSTITSAFSNALTGGLGGSTGNTSSSSGYGGDSSGGYTIANNDGTASGGNVAAPQTPAGKGSAQSFIDIAKSQLGVVEKHDNITPYGAFTGANGQPWCASFVSWAMDKTFNGDKEKRTAALRGPMSAAVSGLWDNFKKANAMTMKPQPGDIVIYKNGSSHIGLVETVNGDNVTTIEGNTSGGNGFERNGGMVARKSFNIHQKKQLTGFGRPDWDAASGAGSMLDKLEGPKKTKPIPKIVPINQPKPMTAKDAKKLVGAGVVQAMENSTATNNTNNNSSVVELLKALIKVAQTIATNTSDVPTIGTTLTNYCNAKLSTDVQAAGAQVVNMQDKMNNKNGGASNKVDPSEDPALKDLMATLGAIAAG